MTVQEKIKDLNLEEIMGERFGRYSKYIIQDRALPDARDGLKPVQRRILYAMHHEGNTQEKPFRKSAKTVGNVIGNYHPHGDSSVYEAMVRMSQDWKLRNVLVEMHGNNGSIDGDPAAAMRYTEARLSAIAGEMLKDITKNTVDFVPNFDDQDLEPTVLPARYPNLLVNGSTGISAGYATDIPPHNLDEVIEAVLMRLAKPTVTVEELMTVIKGPDFPTGGIIQGVEGIKKAYETGRGKIVVRAKAEIETLKGGKSQIVITEIPYEVNKANLVKKMDELRFDKKLDGIAEIRDESDREGLRIVIELKKDTDANVILNFFFKATDLQVNYNFNMIAIHNRRPTMMTLPLLLDAYINHQKEVIKRRTIFDLEKSKKRMHIVEGLIKALSILDKVIETIRSSKDKSNAKANLVEAYEFTDMQAEAIVVLQLYRLTNTDITELKKEAMLLTKEIEKLSAILQDEKKLVAVIRKELREIKKNYPSIRLSTIEEKVETIDVTLEALIPSEEVVLTVTKDGYVKRTSLRSYGASKETDLAMKESDYTLISQKVNTQHDLVLFTNLGNYIYQPIHELPDIRWKELGQHISSIVPLDAEEEVISAYTFEDIAKEDDLSVITVSKEGKIKRSSLNEYKITRYSRATRAMGIKGDDKVIAAYIGHDDDELVIATKDGYALRYQVSDVSLTGVKTGGVKAITMASSDEIVGSFIVDKEDEVVVILERKDTLIKKMPIEEIPLLERGQKGELIIPIYKDQTPSKVLYVNSIKTKDICIEEIGYMNIEDISIMKRFTTFL